MREAEVTERVQRGSRVLRVHSRQCIEGLPRKKPELQSEVIGPGHGKRNLDFEWIALFTDWEEEGCGDQGRGDKKTYYSS